ncbi:hypothetical protein ACT3SQ_03910 [Brachybacterium sp. AOP42-C2-15]|uniref:hypothetical protein n=1 Tax=unclassified Brachybacterium TaxID=2623841 RepID=UPI001861913E|nr:hypothetical protein [Brachybacterium sp. Z12]QNN82946.1 hypothetical protein H3H54_03745 [Brachybacterium sp. Z12]
MNIVEWRHPVRVPEPYRSLFVIAIGVILVRTLLPYSATFTLVVSFVGGAVGIAFALVVLSRGFDPVVPRSWSESGFIVALLLALMLVMSVSEGFSWTGRLIGVIVGIGIAVCAFHVAEVLHQRSSSKSSPRG